MKRTLLSTVLCSTLTVGLSGQANAAQWQVAVTNLTNGSHFTDLLFVAHDASSHLYQTGMAASDALKAMAECGMLTDLTNTLPTGAISGSHSGLTAPGTTSSVDLDTMASGNTHLSIVAMVLPSNDAFVGMDGLQVPTAAGTYTYYLNAYDAGSEANNELVTSGCSVGMPGIPAVPSGSEGMNGTGVTNEESNKMIHVHRGILGDTDSTGGASDLDSTVHRWQNPVAKVTVTVTP